MRPAKRRRRYLSIAIVLLTQAYSARPAPGEEVLSLEQCISLALERHPLIAAARERHQAALARIRQARAFPIPSLFYNSDLQPRFGDFVNSEEAYLGIEQTFELPQKRTLRQRIAEQESLEAETDTELVKLDVIFQVRRAFYELLLAEEKLAYARQDQELAEDYLKMAEVRLAAGDVAKVEVLRARVEALSAANAVRAAASEVSLARARLNVHLGRGKDAPIRIAGQLATPFAELRLAQLQAEALQRRPELRRLRLSVQKQNLVQSQSRWSRWPDLDFNVSRHRLEGLPKTWSFTITAPLAFLFQQRPKAEIAEAQAIARALQRESEHARNSILTEVEEAYTKAQSAREQIVRFQQDILPQAQEVLEMLRFSYQEGEISGIELIEARRTLNASRRAYADALFEYATALAAVDKAVGRMP